jgi:SRSO17 transposase
MTARQAAAPAPGSRETYAAHFDELFSTLSQREGFRRSLDGLLLPAERNKTLTALANAEPIGGAHQPAVQALQWFLSESTWDAAAVTARRVALLRAEPATAPDATGVLVIDETGERKWGTKTAHVGRQDLGSIGKVANGVVSVTSLWADAHVYYPLAVEPFTPPQHFTQGMKDPAYRTKPQIALELVTQAVIDDVPVRVVVADSFYGENDTFRTGLVQPGIGYVLALKPSPAGWAPVGTIKSLAEVARTAAWTAPEAPGEWQPVDRTLRDGHTEQWWALEVQGGPYGPDQRQRVVIATTDPERLPDLTTGYLVTNLPAPDPAGAASSARASADVAAVVRLYGVRNWVEQSYKQVKGALGWNGYHVRQDHSIRRHWALGCCAFAVCWWADSPALIEDLAGLLQPHDNGTPSSSPEPAPAVPESWAALGEQSARGRSVTPRTPSAGVVAGGAPPGTRLVGAVDHARTLLAGLVGAAPAAGTPSPARLGR